MTLTKREKYIAVGVGAALALLLLDSLVLSPYMSQRSSLTTEQVAAQRRLDDAQSLFTRQERLQDIWDDMETGGLKDDPSAADTQAQHAIVAWTEAAGVYLVALKSERTTNENKFQVIGYHVSGTGQMGSIAKLLSAVENATIPVRITDMQISPRREGFDDLKIELGLSTISATPDPNKPAKPAARATALGDDQS